MQQATRLERMGTLAKARRNQLYAHPMNVHFFKFSLADHRKGRSPRRKKAVIQLLVAWIALLMATVASAVDVRGSVRTSSGTPMAGVMVTLVHNQMAGAATVSVFSGSDGHFEMHDVQQATAPEWLFSMRKVGLKQTGIDVKVLADVVEANITVAPVENVAEQVPASAWLADFSLENRGARTVVGDCAGSGCHQFPAARVKRFVRSFSGAASGVADPGRDPSWLATHETIWRGMVQYMRTMSLRFSADTALRWNLKADDPNFAAYISPGQSLFDADEETLVAQALAGAFSAQTFSQYPLEKYQKLVGPLGVTGKTVIREYRLPTDGWTREAAVSSASPDPWVVEDNKSRIGKLDTVTGRVHWVPVPSGVKGPHTINADAAGNFWFSMEESFNVAKFDPREEKWVVYSGFKGFALVHDFCMDEKRLVRMDTTGGVWLTLLGTNQIGRVDPKTGALDAAYDMPLRDGEAKFHAALYGCVMTSDRKHLWVTQLSGLIASFNMETHKIEATFRLPPGAVPHRMAIDENDVVYVAVSGDGQIWALDTRGTDKKPRLYDLPDRNSAPYSVTWDFGRKALWVATANNDAIYKLDPKTGKITEYPLPRREAYLRMIDVDLKTGDLWTSYANLPTGGEQPNFVVQITPGD